MKSDALQGEIKTVPDPSIASSRLIDRPLALNPSARENYHVANGIHDSSESAQILCWNLVSNIGEPVHLFVG
jgi:hypothetical protein